MKLIIYMTKGGSFKTFRQCFEIFVILLLLTCCSNQIKTEYNSSSSLMFESKDDISQLYTVILKVNKNNSTSDILGLVDTLNVCPIYRVIGMDTAWSFSINTPYLKIEELNKVNFEITLMDFNKKFTFSNIKVTNREVVGGVFYSIDSFTCNGVPLKNKMTNNCFDLYLKL